MIGEPRAVARHHGMSEQKKLADGLKIGPMGVM
jgi:hypothetical protein